MNRWVAGARPRTLPAAVVPVLVGHGRARRATARFVAWRAAAALVVALAHPGRHELRQRLQRRRPGHRRRARVGPVRLVGSGPGRAACGGAAAALARVRGRRGGRRWLAAVATWPELLPSAPPAFAAGWLYTGGPRPYGYAGLGEVFVFVFFGLVATAGIGVRAGGAAHVAVVLAGVPGRPPGHGAARGQQPPRHPHRHGRGQAHAGGAPRRRGHTALYVAIVVAAFAAVIGPLAQGRLATAWPVLGLPFAIEPVRTVISGNGPGADPRAAGHGTAAARIRRAC